MSFIPAVISLIKLIKGPVISLILLRIQHIELFVLMFSILILLSLNLKTIKKHLMNIKKKTWILLIIVFMLALFFRLSGDHNHMIFYDEHYLNTIGRNILLHNIAGQCSYISFTSDKLHCNIIQPFTGWSIIISTAYFLFGVGEHVTLYLTSLIGSLTVFLIFTLSYLLFRKESYSLMAAFLFAISMTPTIWSRSSISNIVGLFLILSIFIVQLIYCIDRRSGLNLITVLLFAFSIQTRIEYMMYLPVMIIIYFLFIRCFRKNIFRPDFFKPWLLFFALMVFYVPQVIMILFNYRNIYPAKFSEIFGANLNFFLRQVYYPNFLQIFLMVGLVYSFIRWKKQLLIMFLLYMITLLVYSSTYQMFSRYYLLNLICIMLMQSIGVCVILDFIISHVEKQKGLINALLVAFTIILIFIPSYGMIKRGNIIFDYQVLTLNIPRSAESRLDNGCFIITNSLDEVTFSSGTVLRTMLITSFIPYARYNVWIFDKKYNVCFLYYEGMGCKGPLDSDMTRKDCNTMRDAFDLKPVHSYKRGLLNYGFYKISNKEV